MTTAIEPVESFQEMEDGPGELGALDDGKVPAWNQRNQRFIMVSLPYGSVGGIRRIQDAADGPGPLDAGDDGKVLAWDFDTHRFVVITLPAGVTNHALLTNLDFASSGHTGFEPAGAGAAAVATHVGQPDPHSQYELESANTAAAILTKLLGVDGTGSGLDADTVDGLHAASFLLASQYTAADVLTKLLAVDGAGSGLDADLFDGQSSAAFATSGHSHAAGDATTLDGLDSTAFIPDVNTRANILASTPPAITVAFCSDTLEMAFWTGSAWYFAPLELDADTSTPDMGAYNSDGLGVSDKQGYYSSVITDKILHHTVVGHNDRTETGGIRVSGAELQVYLAGAWNAIVTGFRFLQDSTSQVGELEYKPLGYSNYYGAADGNGNDLGWNGLPLVQQYRASVGGYPAKLVLDGGTF